MLMRNIITNLLLIRREKLQDKYLFIYLFIINT